MIVCLALYLHSLYLVALGQTIPISEPPSLAPDAEGDLLFLLDSSGSVSYHEFAKVKEFIGDLLGPFTFGPRDVQASIVHISTEPSLEFTFNQHGSGQEVQKAIQDIKQLMGDTNTGKALSYVKENLLAGTFGSRTDVPKVMVWVTDGLSTDDISRPMQLLKDLGVTVFIVSTGGGNYLELSEAASQPSETHLHFVDVDDLPIITKELRDSIIDLIRAKRLHAHDITTTSFRLTWPMLLTQVREESYLLEYSLESDVRRRTQKTLSADQIGVFIGSLSPNTTYWVTLTPESNVQYFHPQTIQVTTLPEPVQEISLHVHNITTTSFQLSWPALLSQAKGESYLLEYSLDSDRSRTVQKVLSGDQTSLVLGNLTPNTTYRVTLIPKSNGHLIRPQTMQISTLPEPIKQISLQVHDIATTSFRLSWPALLSKGESYLLEYSLDSDRSRILQEILPGDQTGLVLGNLTPNSTYLVTLTPKSNLRLLRPQTIQVSTLPEPIQELTLQVHDVTTTSFRVTWAKVLSPVKDEVYVLEYSVESGAQERIRKILPGDQTTLVLGNLTPNTTYRVTLSPKSNLLFFRPQSIHVSTLPEPIQEIPVRVSDITTSGFRLTWPHLLSAVNEDIYLLEYSPESDIKRTIWKTLPGAQTSVVLDNLSPNTVYRVTLTPKFNVRYIQPKTLLVSTLPEPLKELQVRVFDVTHTSFRLSWPRLLSLQQERYILEYSLESDVRRSLRKSLPASQTEVLVGNLSPSTTYRVTLTPESNEHLIRPKTIQVSTLPEQLGPSQILISEPTSNSFRVSWGPHLDNVAGYEIQYGPLPSNTVYKVLLDSTINSTVLENLQPNTTYLVTVAARFKDGREKGLSAIACTEEKDVKVSYLRLEDLGSDNLRAIWGSADGNVQGYRVRCRRQARKSSVVNVAPQTHSMVFKDMTSGSINQICVKPIYKDRTGKDLCRRFHTHPATPAEVYPRLRT
uniref:von Willebrand factor A domain-containing protein 1 n=1 Tax=Leptobrachium leishanense TaxID=445787 RepID=A0A8C5WE27_9ANUR